MDLTQDAKDMIKNSEYRSILNEVILLSDELMKAEELQPTELQWTIMINHLNEMIRRAKQNEKIPDVDPEMFAEVSKEALDIAEKVVEKIGNLPIDEKYVLSIHYESVKNN